MNRGCALRLKRSKIRYDFSRISTNGGDRERKLSRDIRAKTHLVVVTTVKDNGKKFYDPFSSSKLLVSVRTYFIFKRFNILSSSPDLFVIVSILRSIAKEAKM